MGVSPLGGGFLQSINGPDRDLFHARYVWRRVSRFSFSFSATFAQMQK
jgi:hypothetical protein